MPELPDIAVYIESLQAKVRGSKLNRVRVLNPFLLRTAVPPISESEGKQVQGIERLGKRVVLALEGDLFLVIPLDDRRTAEVVADRREATRQRPASRSSNSMAARWY